MTAAYLALPLVLLASASAVTPPEQCIIVTLSNVEPNSSASTAEVKGSHTQDKIVVRVSQGSLRGKKVYSEKTGAEYYSFLGIPYAQPPVGDLRFQAPQDPSSWTGVRDATSEGSICPQFDNGPLVGSEDCLFLNVYTPQRPSPSNPKLLPVMVWIHGGSYTYGSGNAVNYGPDFLIRKNVILVTLNYRLGVLGFLGLNNSRISQNNGLKDQLAALKWVQANIAQFGGDKNTVTLFGESSGGSCVDFHVLSPATKGLFHRSIMESGNALDRWAYAQPSSTRQRAFLLGQLLGHSTDDEDALINFLKAASVEELISFQDSALTEEDLLRSADIAFPPTKEGVAAEGAVIFLPDSPVNIWKSGKYQKVPYLTGFNSAEAKMFYTAFINNDSLWEDLTSNMEQFVPPELGLPLGSSKSIELAAEIQKLYFGDVTPTSKDIKSLITLTTDAFYLQGLRRTVHYYPKSSSAPLYVYQFKYEGSLSLSQFCDYGYRFRGAGHSDELGYLFWIHRLQVKERTADAVIRDRMTTMWTNFAKTGNPSERPNIRWDPFTTTTNMYLNIDEKLSMRDLNKIRTKKFAFWDKLYASIDN